VSPVHSLHFLWGRRAGELALFVEECLHTSGGLECRDYFGPVLLAGERMYAESGAAQEQSPRLSG
jgi:hypothetical protein